MDDDGLLGCPDGDEKVWSWPPFVRRERMNKMNNDRKWMGYYSGVFNSSPTVEQHMSPCRLGVPS